MASVNDQIAALQAQIDALKAAQRPRGVAPLSTMGSSGIDYTAQMALPSSAVRALAGAVDGSVIAGIVGDNQKAALRQAPPASRAAPAKRGNGWADARPITSPEGLRYVDAQLDAQDARDNALRRRVGPAK